jgi:hypothetical protein
VASPEDLDTIRAYDDMFRFFKEKLLPIFYTTKKPPMSGFKKFMAQDVAKDSDLDIRQIKIWYDLYDK